MNLFSSTSVESGTLSPAELAISAELKSSVVQPRESHVQHSSSASEAASNPLLAFDPQALSSFEELAQVYDRYLIEARYLRRPEGIAIFVPTQFHVFGLKRFEKALTQYLGAPIYSLEVKRLKEITSSVSPLPKSAPKIQIQTSLPIPSSFRKVDVVEVERKKRQSPPDLISSMAFETPIALTRRWCESLGNGDRGGATNGSRGQVLWIHGAPGSGKTSLLKQLHSWVDLRIPMEFIGSHEFFQEWRRALEAKDTLSFVRKYRKETKILVLENIDELETKEKTQQEVLFTINAILDAGGHIAVSSTKHPVQMRDTLQPSLFSRLFSGLILDMPKPDRGFKENLWRKLLDQHGLNQAQLDVHAYEALLSMNCDTIRKTHTLFINALGRLSWKKTLDSDDLLDLRALYGASQQHQTKHQSPQDTLDRVSKICGVTRSAILGKVRRSDISIARRFVCLALARFNGLTNQAIASLIEKDPSTVSHSLNKIELELEKCKRISDQWNYICHEMGVSPSISS